MARIVSIGSELGSVSYFPAYEWSGGRINTSALTLESSVVRSGSYSIKVSATGTSDRDRWDSRFISSNGNGPYYYRMFFRIDDLPDARIDIFGFINDASSRRGSIKLNTDGTLQMWDVVGQIGSSSSALNLSEWYRIEMYFYNNTSSGYLEISCRLNGTSFASTTTSTNTGGVSRLTLGVSTSTTNYTCYFDDFALNDSSGSYQNSWVNDTKIVHIKPNGQGDNNQIGSGLSTNYQNVDELTPDDATTTNTTLSNSVGDIDDYNLEDTTSSIGSEDTINCVSVGIRYAGGSSSNNDSIVPRIKASSGGTVEEGTTITPVSTSYNTNKNATDFVSTYDLVLYDLPGASSSPWTKSDLDNAQIGFKKTADSTNGVLVSTMWLNIDYTDNASSGKINRMALLGIY